MSTAISPDTIARARARAHAAAIRIAGRGTRKSDGAQVFTTTSSQGETVLHLVVVTADALACDCKAGQRGVYCMHRVVVHDQLVAERAELRRKLEARERRASRPVVSAATVVTAAERDTAPLARRAFSIWASA